MIRRGETYNFVSVACNSQLCPTSVDNDTVRYKTLCDERLCRATNPGLRDEIWILLALSFAMSRSYIIYLSSSVFRPSRVFVGNYIRKQGDDDMIMCKKWSAEPTVLACPSSFTGRRP